MSALTDPESWPARRQWIAVLLLPALPLLLMVNKAYHIDDPLFVWTAQQIAAHPLDFYGFKANWYMQDEPMYRIMQNPPLLSYWLAPFGAVFGWSEPVMHLAMLLPTLAFSLGLYLFARRFTSRPMLAWALAWCCPGLLLSASQVMSDVPMMACWVWAVHAWVTGIDRNSRARCAAAAVLILLGALTKYFALSLVPVLLVYSLLRGERNPYRLALLAVPFAGLFLFEFYTFRLYGIGLFSDAGRFAAEARVRQGATLSGKGLTTLAFMGGCHLAIVLLPLRRNPILAGALAAGAVALGVFAAYRLGGSLFAPVTKLALESIVTQGVFRIDPRYYHYLQWGVFVAAGLYLCALAPIGLYRRRDPESVLLALWTAGLVVFVAAINHFVNGRVVIPLAPALAVLAVRALPAGAAPVWRDAGVRLALGAGLALSLLLAAADYRLAGIARTAAREIMAEVLPKGGRIWLTGHSGFQYYTQELGAKSIDSTQDMALPGDWYLLPKNNWSHIGLAVTQVGEHKVSTYTPMPGLTASHYQCFAGFYSDDTGPLPYAFGPVPPELFVTVRIKPPPNLPTFR